MSRPRMVCRADGQPMAWVFTRGAWVLPEHCSDVLGMEWTEKHRIAAWYWMRDPNFTAEKAGTAYYPGTTPLIALVVLPLLIGWHEYPPVFPEPQPCSLYGAALQPKGVA